MQESHLPWRWIVAGMSHFGFIVMYALRVDLSVALVAMINNTYAAKTGDPECSERNDKRLVYNGGEFNWDQAKQGYILSSFFYGYICTQLLGGVLAVRFGGKWLFGIGVLFASVLTLLTPIAARWSPGALIVVRVLEGVGEGVAFPAMHALVSQWAPPKDRSIFAAVAYSGIHIGTVITLPVSGLLCDSKSLGGWPSVFYVFGGLGIVWFFLWSVLVYSRPEDHPFISDDEKWYIIQSLSTSSVHAKDTYIPWKGILLSMPQWSITVCHFCNNWVWYMILTGLPLYFQQVLGFDIKKNGFLSALPFLAGFITANISGVMADYARRNWFTTTAVRRFCTFVGFVPCGIFLLLASYAGCDEVDLSVLYMTMATAMLCINLSGFNVNHVDISPRYSSILMGISNTAGTLAGCLTPTVTGLFTDHHATREQYRKVFALAASICTCGGLFYLVFGSGEEQSWNKGRRHRPVADDTDSLINEEG